jgi:hypothetical protein
MQSRCLRRERLLVGCPFARGGDRSLGCDGRARLSHAIGRGLCGGVAFGSTEFHVLRATKRVMPEWLFYFWRFPPTRKLAAVNMTGSAGQKRVPASFLETADIPLPEMSEQQRIVGRLEQADRLLRTRRYALELTDTFLPAAFLELFGETGDNFPAPAVDELAADKPHAIRTGPFGSQLLHSEFTDKVRTIEALHGVSRRRYHHDHGHLWSVRDRPRRHSDGDQHEASVLHRVTTSADAIKPTDRDENDHVIYCDGYLEGAMTAVLMLENDLICAPRNARPVDVVRLVVDRLQRHPEDKRKLLAMVIWNAALDGWHCK